MKTFGIAAVVIAAAMFGSTAMAAPAPIATFSFDHMDADYDGAGNFTLNTALDTIGDATRAVPVVGTAIYDNDATNGFANSWYTLGTMADVTMSMTVSNITATSADAIGSFVVTDADGDTITGDFTGVWSNVAGFAFFGGPATNVFYNDNFALDGKFNGPSGGMFDLAFPSPQPFQRFCGRPHVRRLVH